MAGIIGDWFLTPLAKTFSRQYPDLLPKDIKSPPEALFNSKIGLPSYPISFRDIRQAS
jgi:hypothetical protein